MSRFAPMRGVVFAALSLLSFRATVQAMQVVSTDSAGVRVVELDQLSLAIAPQHLAEQPHTSIGAVEGDESQLLFRVTGVHRLSDGRLVLLNNGTQEVRLFDSTGVLLSHQGGVGSGPGEYRQAMALWVGPGDSLFVWDHLLRRITVLTPGGDYARGFPTAGAGDRLLAGVFPDGSVLLPTAERPGAPSAGDRQLLYRVLNRYDPETEALYQLGRFPWQTMVLHRYPNGAIGASPGLLLDGESKCAVSGSTVWVGTSRKTELTRIGMDGQVELVVRWPDGNRTVTQAIRDAYWEDHHVTAGYPQTEFAEQFPAHSMLLGDREGGVWVERYRPPGETGPTTWVHLDHTGTPAAHLLLPEQYECQWIGEGVAVVLERDASDVEFIRVFRVRDGA